MSNRVADYIERIAKGKENIVTGSQISRALNMNSVEIRKHVNAARCHGVPICSNSSGYFYSTDKRDIDETVRQLKSRASKIWDSINGLTNMENINEQA